MKIIFFLLLLYPLASISAVLKVKIEKFDQGTKGEPDLIFLSDGRVGILPRNLSISSLRRSLINEGSTIKLKMSQSHKVESIDVINEEIDSTSTELSSREIMSYEPTILPDLETVNSIFKKMNRRWQRNSQCYNRAHVWSYEEFKRSGLLSKKVFIFYTRRYIRNYNFYWWFHAIPTVLANSEGTIVERALDPMFARSPLPMKMWSDIFIRSKRECPVITKYSQYANNQESEDCYLHFSSMYFWQPRDLDKLERSGFEKTSFINSEVDYAYWEAF